MNEEELTVETWQNAVNKLVLSGRISDDNRLAMDLILMDSLMQIKANIGHIVIDEFASDTVH